MLFIKHKPHFLSNFGSLTRIQTSGGEEIPLRPPLGWQYALLPREYQLSPKGMVPNVDGWVWNALLKVYSSLNMYHLIGERFQEGRTCLSLQPTHRATSTC